MLEAWLSLDFCSWEGFATRQNFDPVVVGVENECNIFHVAVGRLFLKVYTLTDKSVTKFNNIVNDEPDVAEPPRITVSIVVLEVRVSFSAVVVRQLQYGVRYLVQIRHRLA